MAIKVSLKEIKSGGVSILNESELPDLEKSGYELMIKSILNEEYRSAVYSVFDPNGKKVIGDIRPEFRERNYMGHRYVPEGQL
jgi:hypothetical protein